MSPKYVALERVVDLLVVVRSSYVQIHHFRIWYTALNFAESRNLDPWSINLHTMMFTNNLRAFLALWLLKQADTQTVTVTIGEFDSRVFIEWYGSVTVLPAPYLTATFRTIFFSLGKDIDLHGVSYAASCKYCTDFNCCACKITCRGGRASNDPLCGFSVVSSN